MHANTLSEVVERYVGVVNNKDTWEIVYDPKKHNFGQLAFMISEVRKEERERFKKQLLELSKSIA